ncbi:MAG: NRDE family protein [Planctomycetes bacterium]|nr:NRDE family protein [Planctomycetota bacterium]
MCTVTFLPRPGGGYLLGTNRDERPSRGLGRPPVEQVVDGRRVLHPVDADAGGTWVAVDERGATLCILNGDREPAAPAPDDPPSRGVLVLELARDARRAAVLDELERRARRGALRQRPFKLVLAEPGDAVRPAASSVITWDGRDLGRDDAPGARVVVSSTFETDAVTAFREALFADFLRALDEADARGVAAPARALATWHAAHRPEAVDGDAYSVCMHRDDAGTVSSTQVEVGERRVALSYRQGAPCRAAPTVTLALVRAPAPLAG